MAKLKPDADAVVPVRVTVNVMTLVPTLPSVIDTSLIAKVGNSSSIIVPVPVAVLIVALVAPDNPTVKVSSPSKTISPLTKTVNVAVVWPGVKVKVPFFAV